MTRIVFVAPPFAGHFNPMLVLAKAAREAGYAVEFITGPRKFETLRQQGFEPAVLRSLGDDTLEAIANTAEPVGNNPFRLLMQFRENLRLLPAIGEELEQRWRASPPSVVVADSVAPIAGLVAERVRIPWVTTIATPFSIEARRGTPSYCGGWGPPRGAMGLVRDAAGRTAIHSFKTMVGLLFREEFRKLGLAGVYREDGAEAIYSPHSILGFGLRELEFDRDWPPQFQMIGPLIESPEPSTPIVLPPRPRVLVTHGTHLLWAKRTLCDTVRVLADQMPEVSFVVSMGDAKASVPVSRDRVAVFPFVAYDKHLVEFDAILHHGGAGVTYAAILAGVPSVVVPRDYDQFDYAARIVHHGLGLRAQSVEEAAPALYRALDRRQWTALAWFKQWARAYEPERAFLETVKRLSQSL